MTAFIFYDFEFYHKSCFINQFFAAKQKWFSQNATV